jgi:hypothetical protein
MASMLGFALNHQRGQDFMQSVHLQWLIDAQCASTSPDAPPLDPTLPWRAINEAITVLAGWLDSPDDQTRRGPLPPPQAGSLQRPTTAVCRQAQHDLSLATDSLDDDTRVSTAD